VVKGEIDQCEKNTSEPPREGKWTSPTVNKRQKGAGGEETGKRGSHKAQTGEHVIEKARKVKTEKAGRKQRRKGEGK